MSVMTLPLRALAALFLLSAAAVANAQDCAVYDEATCGNQLYSADATRLQQWCEQGTGVACSGLLREWVSEARQADTRAPNDDPDLQEPAVCKEAHPAYDAQACEVAAKAALSKAMGMALTGVFDQREIVLPAGRLASLQSLCVAHPDGDFCREVAEEQWKAGAFVQAVAALQLSCRSGDERACELHAPLQALGSAARPQPATALPCGEYRSDGGLLDTLDFADGGLVGMGMGAQARARLEDGEIRLRHDKGGDFVFQALPGGKLVGMDEWTRMRVFQRSGGPAQCTAPVVFNVVPLPRDCPQAGSADGAAACCKAGSLQGCNTLGNQQALSGEWVQAAGSYLQVCRAGVREGCENLASAQENSADVDARAQLQQLCEADRSGRHVACDVVATRNWTLMELGRALQDAADQSSKDDAPAAPRTGNHKR